MKVNHGTQSYIPSALEYQHEHATSIQTLTSRGRYFCAMTILAGEVIQTICLRAPNQTRG